MAIDRWHESPAAEVLRQLGTSDHGLDRNEAAARLSRFGPNDLPRSRRRSAGAVFLRQFASPLIYILFVAAVIALAMGHKEDALVILVVVCLNAIIGTVQEGRAEKSMESLRRLSGLKARVCRNGNDELIEARGIVPGDILSLAAGDAVGADARLIKASALETSEAALTGESLPVPKHAEPLPRETTVADRRNIVYAGTHVAAGRGKAVAVATGRATELGKIAQLTAAAVDPGTPLDLRIQRFGRYLVGAALMLFAVVISLGLLRGMPFLDILMVAITQMVSMVPEGLPAAVTIALAVGMQRMAKRGAIVRRLAAVETLGSTSVICTDKTGTLTRGEMTVTALMLGDGRRIEVTGTGYSPEGKLLAEGHEMNAESDIALRTLLEAATLCNDAQLVPPDSADRRWRALGDPTEAALITVALKGCVDAEALRQRQPRRGEIPFDPAAKMMATQHGHDVAPRVFIKGAPEQVLGLCGTVLKKPAPLP